MSCKKEATAQATSSCSETATVNITVNIPANRTIYSLVDSTDYVWLSGHSSVTEKVIYVHDITTMGTAHTQLFTYKNVLPGDYTYFASFHYGPNSVNDICSSAQKQQTIQAGQTYNISIDASDFTCP